MPIYEFRCQECNKVSEFQLKIADPHPKDCPGCGQAGLKKIMSLPAFQLKGGGWYADSYDGRSNKKADPSPASAESASPSAAPAAAATSPSAPAASASAPAPAAAAPSSSKDKS